MNNTPKMRLAYIDGKERECSVKEFLFVEDDGKLYAYPISDLNREPEVVKPPMPVTRSSQNFHKRFVREYTLSLESETAERVRQTIDARDVSGYAIPRKVGGAE